MNESERQATNDLRAVVEQATPGPWTHDHPKDPTRSMLCGGPKNIIVCDPYGPNPQDADLIALAPDLGALVIDMADVLADWGANDKKIPPLLARYAALGET